ncbi:hypothetical protein [Undibacterium sp. Ren11W]|uniref:hypothetical protein n=1 Tax=Undibacterium sp. Ren11W TaxID=3413045 RepID=UPI003BEFFFE5
MSATWGIRLALISLTCIVAVNGFAETALSPMSNPVFSKQIELHGKLGKDVVRMKLQPKLEDADSVEGSYLVQGAKRNPGHKILLAGEITGNKLTMEESEDGVDVSGQWDGELIGTSLRGIWQSDDGKRSESFVLELMPIKNYTKAKKSVSIK